MSFPLRSAVLYVCLHLVAHLIPSINSQLISSSKSRVWGPGLNADLSLPVRYIFIHLFDEHGQPLTTFPGTNRLQFSVEGVDSYCRLHRQLIDRHDGSFIARFRLLDSCSGLRISVQLDDGVHLAKSPYILPGRTFPADCVHQQSLATWKQAMSCPESFKQLDQDLEVAVELGSVGIEEHFQSLAGRYHPGAASFCLYSIRQNQLYRKCNGEHVGFAVFMDDTLLFLLRRVVLPDMDFIVNLGDYPLTAKSGHRSFKAPVFSWCGSEDSYDIVMPTYDLTESSLYMMNRVLVDMMSVQSATNLSWSQRTPKAFWRGRDSRPERLKLIEIARNHSDLIDAALTNFFFYRDQEATHGPKAPHVDFFRFFDFKYQLNLDGTVAAYRFPYLLAGGSVVFKQESQYYEHFYGDLEAWKHYIPVKRDLSDLVDRINWAMENDEDAEKIARRAEEYARNHLMPTDVFCYYTILLEKWSGKVKVAEKIPEGSVLIAQPEQKDYCQFESHEQNNRVEL